MKYFKNQVTEEVFGYDETDETQLPYMQVAIDANYLDITGNYPPPPPPYVEPPKPTLTDLQNQLAILQAQIQELANSTGVQL